MPYETDRWTQLDVSWTPSPDEHALFVVDLPGEESVWMGLALASRGYQPVPIYNACTGASEVIDQRSILNALIAGAPHLAGLYLADAPPAFLMDSRRMKAPRAVVTGDFDNRWKVFPDDLPSAEHLKSLSFLKVIVVHRKQEQLGVDLQGVLRAWQTEGIRIELKDPDDISPPRPTTIARPGWFKRFLEFLKSATVVGSKPDGGFGHLVREKRHG
jgi:hypothetical protein